MRPEVLAAPWDETHPLPPLLGYMGGAVPDLLSGQRLLSEKWGGESEGRGRSKEREGSTLGGGLPSQTLRVPERRFPGAWLRPCPWGTLSSAQSCTSSPRAP